MERYFNTEGACFPREHYMVNLDSRLAEIKKYVDRGKYFAINRGRQYGKTTTLAALAEYLKDDYVVVSLDFQFISTSTFTTESSFISGFSKLLWGNISARNSMSDEVRTEIKELRSADDRTTLIDLFICLGQWCSETDRPIVLIIDEVDSASNNQVFLDFLAQLRGYYLHRAARPTFQSVILAGVHDIRNLRQKIRPDSEHKHNSPWNIAAKFNVEMNFTADDIKGMLEDYESDHGTGMDTLEMSELLFEYTSGYPVLVSSICKIMDEDVGEWSKSAFLEAVKTLLLEKMPLFESLINKLEDSERLCSFVKDILFNGAQISYNPDDDTINNAMMFGFVKNENNLVAISNRIFEVRIYNWLLSQETINNRLSFIGADEKPQFVKNGKLNMELVFEKFVQHFDDIYGDNSDTFKEEDGRKFFLLYLRPIINGTGNYYIEAETRNRRRTDVIVDYAGEQFIIELKIWHGERYNSEGQQQISDYLDYYHLDKGYMVSFNFNKNKQSGVGTVEVGGKMLVEAIV